MDRRGVGFWELWSFVVIAIFFFDRIISFSLFCIITDNYINLQKDVLEFLIFVCHWRAHSPRPLSRDWQWNACVGLVCVLGRCEWRDAWAESSDVWFLHALLVRALLWSMLWHAKVSLWRFERKPWIYFHMSQGNMFLSSFFLWIIYSFCWPLTSLLSSQSSLWPCLKWSQCTEVFWG